MVTPPKHRFLLMLVLVLTAAVLGTAGAAGKPKPPRKTAEEFPERCATRAKTPALRDIPRYDAWRNSKAYAYPFFGHTPHGQGSIIWSKIKGAPLRSAPYPRPNLPTCRVGRFGTEDRGTDKAGKFIPMLQAIDGSRSYELKDTFDRTVATLQWLDDPPVKFHPSKWGWFINGQWAGHDATRAIEVQGNACKLVSVATASGPMWVRDPAYTMIAFNPSLGSPGRGYLPRRNKHLRVRAFIDRRALPSSVASYAASRNHDFGCGESDVPPWQAESTLSDFQFRSDFGPGKEYMRGYYFGEGAVTRFVLAGERKLYNYMPYSNYNPRPLLNGAAYAMIASTAVAGGGMVRGLVRANVDRFTLYDEMRYCDPNYTLRNAQLVRFKRHLKKSRYFPPWTYNIANRPAVRWVFGRIDPDPATLTPDQAAATANLDSQHLFAWMPIYCKVATFQNKRLKRDNP